MPLPFSNTTDRTGIIELLEDLTTTQSATTSSYPLKTKTRDINNAYAWFMMLAIKYSGRWQVDDTSHTDYPIITFNLVADQDNYAFTDDGATPANQILDFYNVRIKDSNSKWLNLKPIDRVEDALLINEYDNGATGTPIKYDMTSNGIIFYPTPSYSLTNGVELYVARTPVYFLSTDTTKEAGIPDMFHEYLALKPAYRYAFSNGLKQVNNLKAELLDMESGIKSYYSRRRRNEVNVITPQNIQNFI